MRGMHVRTGIERKKSIKYLITNYLKRKMGNFYIVTYKFLSG
jgi:hypothetical protein